jgi:hypothetical protein
MSREVEFYLLALSFSFAGLSWVSARKGRRSSVSTLTSTT